MRLVLVIVVVLAVLTDGLSGRALTLKRALNLAQEHSLKMKGASSQVEAARLACRSAGRDRWPSISVNANSFYNSEVPSLDIELPPPASVSLSRELGTSETYHLDLRLSLPLSTGGRISNNIEQTWANLDYYRAFDQLETDRSVFQARLAYLSLARADRMHTAAGASLRRAEIINDNVRSLHAAGAADSIDLLEAHLALTEAASRVETAGRKYRLAEIDLLTILGLPLSESLELAAIPEASHQNVNTTKLLPVSFGKPELAMADASIAASRSRIKFARAEYFPNITAYAGYSVGKPGLDRFNNNWNDYFTIGTNLVWSFNIGNKTGITAGMLESRYRAAQYQRDQITEDINREAQLTLEKLKLTDQQYITARKRYEISSDKYRLATQKHRRGALSVNRLLEIEAALTKTQAILVAAQIDHQIALSAHYFAVGSDKLKEGF
ncbi:MAG: TolC family protein [candidate division Zixibacteria bacterium]|nr:TolC family protein [candidate division Zixibacteria bacterium]